MGRNTGLACPSVHPSVRLSCFRAWESMCRFLGRVCAALWRSSALDQRWCIFQFDNIAVTYLPAYWRDRCLTDSQLMSHPLLLMMTSLIDQPYLRDQLLTGQQRHRAVVFNGRFWCTLIFSYFIGHVCMRRLLSLLFMHSWATFSRMLIKKFKWLNVG